MQRRRAILAICAVLMAAAGAAAALLWSPQPEYDREALRKARLMEDIMFGRAAIGGPFSLMDHTGQRRALAEWRGKLVLLYFGYTFCPDVCPTDLQ